MKHKKHKKHKNLSSFLLKAIAVIVGCIAIIGIVGLVYLSVTNPTKKINQRSMCIIDEPYTDILAIIIDSTDSIPARSSRQAEEYFRQAILELPINSLVTLYKIDETNESHALPVLIMCRPDDGTHANSMTSNPKLIQKMFQTQFWKPVNQVLTSLIKQQPSKSSPIIESIQSAVIESFQANQNTGQDRIIVLSDLLQHSNLFSHYGVLPNFENYQQKTKKSGLGSLNLDNIHVELLIIPRSIPLGSRQNLIQFWADFLKGHKAKLRSLLVPLS
jgi:hypothetical protein